MADITDLAQQLAYYQAGGGRPKPMDEFNSAFKSVGDVGDKYLSVINDVLKNKKLELENTKLKTENAPYVEQYGNPSIRADLRLAETTPVPPQDLMSGRLDSRQGGRQP